MKDKHPIIDLRNDPVEVDLLVLNDRESCLIISLNQGRRDEETMVLMLKSEQVNVQRLQDRRKRA